MCRSEAGAVTRCGFPLDGYRNGTVRHEVGLSSVENVPNLTTLSVCEAEVEISIVSKLRRLTRLRLNDFEQVGPNTPIEWPELESLTLEYA